VLGIAMVLLAGVFFCIQNVIVRILFNDFTLWGQWHTGGFVETSLQSSFLLMFLRMAAGVPLLGMVSALLYRPVWRDMATLRYPQNRRTLGLALAGGGLMFLYLALLYLAIGQIETGVALTLFFTFPIFTALLSWVWFGLRPSLLRWGVMAAILAGSWLTMPPTSGTSEVTQSGVLLAIGAGGAYALYTVVAQKSFEVFHPVPFTWISFAVTLGLSGLCVALSGPDWAALPWGPLWVGSVLSAVVTFGGHVLNNLGIRSIGATATAMIGAANPALTVMLAWFAMAETLSGSQLVGVGIVTGCVALLSWDAG